MRQFFARLLDVVNDMQRQSASPMASLDRSIASAQRAHTDARRALAIALAEEAREAERRACVSAKISDLEQRAVQALRAGRDDLALQAAEAIAAMTTDITASERASLRFAAEVALARREVDAQRRRLSELDRGRRLARIGSALSGTSSTSPEGLDSFTEAEAALARVVAENHDARVLREELASPAERLIERMSDAGIGEAVQIRAADVLARLRGAAGLQPVSAPLIDSTCNP
jgi:phage shock protein A